MQTFETVRNHDRLYLDEDRKHQPKEYFKFIGRHVESFLQKLAAPRILDIGCATGDFLWYITQQFPHAQCTGIDVMPELLERAAREVPAAEFCYGSILDDEPMLGERFDAVFMNGVHSIFDDYERCFSNVTHLVNRKRAGRAFVFGLFNPEPVDVLVKARRSGELGPWQTGWNYFSEQTIRSYLEANGATVNFIPFEIEIDIPRHDDDPLRSWTFRREDGNRAIIHGTQLLHHLQLLEISFSE